MSADSNMSASIKVKELAPVVLAEIKKAKSILLHLHPSPDPDSAGSALAMKFALEQLGKKVTVIGGDSPLPVGFAHFPGAKDVLAQNYLETDISAFDLFLILDSARIEMVSRRGEVTFPNTLKTIAIDHHFSNSNYAEINLVDHSYPANCLLLYDLFMLWGIKLSPEIASNLFIGMYTDTGGFKFSSVTPHTYEAAAKLVAFIPNVSSLITTMENTNTAEFIRFQALALNSIEVHLGVFALAMVTGADLAAKNIPVKDVRTNDTSSFMLSVSDWQFTAVGVELEPNVVKFSFRSKDIEKYDVAKLTNALGGGGHRAAAGLILKMSVEQAKKTVVSKAKELYNL
jgi:phosphoesterase RecJ-like protein